MEAHKFVCIFLICFGAVTSQAKENCDKAMDAIPKHDSGKHMFYEISNFKKKYGQCLDGSVAEGVAALVVDSLDKTWNQASEIEDINKNDSTFENFILNNIEPRVTAQEKEVSNVISHAKKECPKSMTNFCRKLVKACEKSLKPES